MALFCLKTLGSYLLQIQVDCDMEISFQYLSEKQNFYELYVAHKKWLLNLKSQSTPTMYLVEFQDLSTQSSPSTVFRTITTVFLNLDYSFLLKRLLSCQNFPASMENAVTSTNSCSKVYHRLFRGLQILKHHELPNFKIVIVEDNHSNMLKCCDDQREFSKSKQRQCTHCYYLHQQDAMVPLVTRLTWVSTCTSASITSISLSPTCWLYSKGLVRIQGNRTW